MSPLIITILVLVAAVAAFLSGRISPPLVALGVALALFLTGVNDLSATLAGFGDPIVLYIAGLFVVSEALDATGVTAWAGQQLTRRAGEGRSRVLIALMLLSALLTAFISVNGAVAAMLPVGVMLAARTRMKPSRLLIPMAFAAHAGSMLTLLGTPVNVLVNELSVAAGGRAFGFFEFALVGVPLLTGVLLITLLLGPRLLPERQPENAPRDLSRYAETLAREHGLGKGEAALSTSTGAIEVVIPPRSSILGDEVHPGMMLESGDLVVTSVQRRGTAVDRAELEVGDVLVLRGAWDALSRRTRRPSVLGVEDPDLLRRQTVQLGGRAAVALAVMGVMCVLLALQALPPAIIVLLAAVVLMLARIVTFEQAQRSLSLSTLVIVAGMIPLSSAIQSSGAADLLSSWLVERLGASDPRLLLVGLVVIVLILGQFVSNLASVLIVAPVADAVASTAGISPLPLMMGIAVAGAAAFLTPVATPGNLMIQEAGAYRFGDYWRLGLPCLLWFGVVATVLVPIIWPF
ncbi:SLC13 family permease [Brachybacterium sp. DNPG3]